MMTSMILYYYYFFKQKDRKVYYTYKGVNSKAMNAKNNMNTNT